MTVPVSCTDHTCWQRLLVCVCARLARLRWHVPMVWGGIRAQLSEWRSLLCVSDAMQAGSGFAGRTGLCCFFLFFCSVPVLWLVLGPVSISALMSSSFIFRFPSSSVSPSQQCAQQHDYRTASGAVKSSSWGMLTLTSCRIYHSSNCQNPFRRLSEIPFVIGIIHCYQGRCFPSGDPFPIFQIIYLI